MVFGYLWEVKEYKKYFRIPAPPDEVYQALTIPTAIMLWTGEEAEMSTEPGSEFSLWSGNIVGRNVAFEENRKVVQQWYFGEQEAESLVTLILHPDEDGTSVELRHTNIPDEAYDEVVDGWTGLYFPSLREFFEE